MNVELDTLTKTTSKLNLAVRSHILPLADQLLGEGLITSENHSSLLNTRKDEVERASLLGKFVRKKVTLDSKNYHVFVKVLLSDKDTYKEVLEDLEPIYKEPTNDVLPATCGLASNAPSGNFFGAVLVLISVLLFAIVTVYWEPRIDGVSSQPLPQKKNENSILKTPTPPSSSALTSANESFQQKDHIADLIESLSKLAQSPLINEGDKADRLTKIASNLRSGTLSCGVVGLSKAGKSTTLNALLGCDFLPTSQIETDVNVAIFHNPNAPKGILYNENNGKLEQLRTGCREIREYLYKVNDNARAGTKAPPRLVLHVPILLLEDGLNSVNVTLAHAPGLSEAIVKNSTIRASGYGALKDMFAFILIMNLEYLKSEAEVNLLRELFFYHPELLKKLDRIIILVNRYEATFRNNYSKSLKPENISKYVSDYLAEPRVLNVTIPPEHILPYSAFWGLKSRMWSLNSSFMTEDDYFNYEDAIDILLKAGVIEEHETDPADRDTVIAKLMIFSKLQLVEKEIRRMLQSQGPKILLKAAADDSRGILLHINDTIIERKKELEQELSLKRRLNSVKLANIAESSREVKEEIETLHLSYSSELGSETVSLQESLVRLVEAGIREHVSDLKWVEDREKLKSRLKYLKLVIINILHNKLENIWMSIMNILDNVYENNIEIIRSHLGSTYHQLLECTTNEDTKTMLEREILLESSASPSSVTINFLLTADYIDLTRRIDEKREIRWITKYYTKTTNCGFLWLDRETKTISYDVSESYMLYAADERSLKADFYPFISELVNLWKNKLDEAIRSSVQVLYDNTYRIERATQAVRSEIDKNESEMNMKIEELKNAQRNIDEILTQLNEH